MITLYLFFAFLYGIFGTFAWGLGMTTVPLFGIWAWWFIPWCVVMLFKLGQGL